MALVLGVQKDKEGKSSFEHILRQEAKFDADFLFSLDFFDGKMVRNCLNYFFLLNIEYWLEIFLHILEYSSAVFF